MSELRSAALVDSVGAVVVIGYPSFPEIFGYVNARLTFFATTVGDSIIPHRRFSGIRAAR